MDQEIFFRESIGESAFCVSVVVFEVRGFSTLKCEQNTVDVANPGMLYIQFAVWTLALANTVK